MEKYLSLLEKDILKIESIRMLQYKLEKPTLINLLFL